MSIKERIEGIRGHINNYNISSAMEGIRDLSDEYGYYDVIDNVVDTDYLDEMVKMRLESSGWQGVACMLSDINSLNDEYYSLDGYGNIEDFHISDCEMILDELEDLLEDEIREEEEDEEEEEEEEDEEEEEVI